MLDYSKFTELLPEIQDPVSGDFFPASAQDVKSLQAQKMEAEQVNKAQSSILSMLTSVFK